MKEVFVGNILIADFINLNDGNWRNQVIIDASNGRNIPRENTLMYHSSWDCLIPVVEKIQGIVIREGHEVCVEFYEGLPNVKETYVTIGENVEVSHPDPKTAIWLAVVQFIKLYNKENN